LAREFVRDPAPQSRTARAGRTHLDGSEGVQLELVRQIAQCRIVAHLGPSERKRFA
jgi:hypothetical protein